MSPRRLSATLLVSVALLAACGGGGPATTPPVTATTGPTTSSGPTTSATTGPTTPSTTGPTTSAPATTAPTTVREPFDSANYGYTVTSTDWTGTDATEVWDGTGAPGDGSPFVDTLEGPEGVRAFAVAEPTDATLEEYVAASRKANAKGHPCPPEPEKTRSTTVGGEPATLDETHCPPGAGPYAINVIAIHDGTAYSFFTYTTAPGAGAFTRGWFEDLLPLISFDA